MVLGRLFGWVLLLSSLVVLTRDLAGWYDLGHYAPADFLTLWTELSPRSHAAVAEFGSRHIGWAWEGPMRATLFFPAWPSLFALGLITLYFCRNRLSEKRQQQASRH